MPERIQLSRRKGWRMPPNTVYVGRPSLWGNPFHYERRDESMRAFEALLVREPSRITSIRRELRGKNLACWCPLEDAQGNRVPCHADVLLRIANAE